MKKDRFLIFEPEHGNEIWFNSLKEIRKYVAENQSDYTDFRYRHVFNSNGERVYLIQVKLHRLHGFVEHVTLSSLVY